MVDDLLAHVFYHLFALRCGQLYRTFLQDRRRNDDDVLRSKRVLNGILGGSLPTSGIVKDLIHGQKIVDVHRVGRFLERFNHGRVNEDFVSFTALFKSGENGIVKANHTITQLAQR